MTDKKPLNINIQSEIGQLDAVLLHTPGAEVENMTPKMAQRALYSDILNLSIAQEEYAQLSGVLEKLAKVRRRAPGPHRQDLRHGTGHRLLRHAHGHVLGPSG